MYEMRTVLQPLIPGFQEMTRFAEMQKKTPARWNLPRFQAARQLLLDSVDTSGF